MKIYININTAGEDKLQELHGIGPACKVKIYLVLGN